MCHYFIVYVKFSDWLKLRKVHRILGECIGCIAKRPRQETISGLPVLLLPEEAKLLVEKGIARLIGKPILKETPTESLRKKFEEYREKLFAEQEACLTEQRRIQVFYFLRLILMLVAVEVMNFIFSIG